jgi:hypothetical protein
MSQPYNPVGDLAAALAHAQYQAFSEVHYQDRDWDQYRKWRAEYFDKLSREEQSALYKQERETGMPLGPENSMVEKTRRPHLGEIRVQAMFPQTWSSTALGFGGIGGQAITSAYTIILECNSEYAVYFAGQHAYTVQQPTDKFFRDLDKRCMLEVSRRAAYFQQKDKVQ